MNRIIIVGNGFDLAHDLKTRYEDFINWYWDKWLKLLNNSISQFEEDELFKISAKYNSDCLCNYFYLGCTERNVYKHIEKVRQENGLSYIISPILKRISESIETKGWVDIEADYYAMLVECMGKKDELERLNRDFAVIQNLLVEYLNEIQEKDINEKILIDEIQNQMLLPFSAKEISVESNLLWRTFATKRVNGNKEDYRQHLKDFGYENVDCDYLNEIGHQEYSKLVDGKKVSDDIEYLLFLPNRVMLLNFNYTKTADLYLPQNGGFIVNHIHGELEKPESVIFGYGDESDDEYKKLQKFNDNEYLRHIKTNRYLETPNYRDLLAFIDSAPFQVCIMGHSCGLSDKTLLNTLFEHKNCVSIKPYYYVNEQGKDNYLDIVQNISRNFTNPQLMRDRVVNKTYCSPLPQKGKELIAFR